MKRFDVIVLVSAVALVAGGGGYALGHLTAGKSTAAASSTQPGSGNGMMGGGTAGGGGGFRRGGFGTRGTVTAVSGNTITITDQSGATRTVSVSSTTTYLNGADRSQASLSDVTSGTTILAAGPSSSGAINATRIVINPPAPRNFGGGGGGAPSGSQVN
jgi:hypothetical protein